MGWNSTSVKDKFWLVLMTGAIALCAMGVLKDELSKLTLTGVDSSNDPFSNLRNEN